MSNVRQQTNDLIAQIYDAALDQSQWTKVLESFRDRMEGNIAVLILGGGISPQDDMMLTVGMEDAALCSYFSHYYQYDPLLPYVRNAPIGTIITAESTHQRRSMEQSAFYNEWAQPQGMFDSAFTPILKNGQSYGLLGISQSSENRRFTVEDCRDLAGLTLHVARALQIYLRLSATEADRETAVSAMSGEAILVDIQGRVVFANPAAGKRLEANDGLGLAGSMITASTPAQTSTLLRLIKQAADPWAQSQPGGIVQISHGIKKDPLTIFVVPVQRASRWLGAQGAAAMILIRDSEGTPASASKVLTRLYGLTAAEVRVADLLLANHTLEQTAQALGVQIGTVRNQLKQIFSKTNTHRQTELMRLLLSLPVLPGEPKNCTSSDSRIIRSSSSRQTSNRAL